MNWDSLKICADFAEDSELNQELLALLEPETKPKAKANPPPKKIAAKDEDEIIKQMEMSIAEEPEESDETSKLINFDLTIPSKGKMGSYPTLQLNEEPPAVIPKLNFQAAIEPDVRTESRGSNRIRTN